MTTPASEIQLTCSDCGRNWWSRVPKRGGLPSSCPRCEYEKRNGKKRTPSHSTAALVPAGINERDESLALALPNQAAFVQELRALVNEAHTHYALREATFWERLNGRADAPWHEEQNRKEWARYAVAQLIAREEAMLEGIKKTEAVRLEAEAELIRSRNEVLAAHLEQLRLLERIGTFQKKASTKVCRPRKALKAAPSEIDPSEMEPEAALETDAETRFVLERQKKKARERALAQQALISEFLREVRQVFNHPTLERTERAIRIRSLLDSFDRSVDDLPAQIWRFLAAEEAEGDAE